MPPKKPSGKKKAVAARRSPQPARRETKAPRPPARREMEASIPPARRETEAPIPPVRR